MKLKLYLLKKKAKKFGIKINAFSNISEKSAIIVESPSSLGDAKIVSHNPVNSETTLGAHSYIRSGTIESTTDIGRFCSFGQDVTIGQSKKTHPIDWVSTSHALSLDYKHIPKKTTIGNDVWIGDGAVIMEGVEVGHGAIVGKNALVTKNVDHYQIVAGNPARPIRYRFDKLVRKYLLESSWWELDLEELQKIDYKNTENFIKSIHSIKKKAHYKKLHIRRKEVSAING